MRTQVNFVEAHAVGADFVLMRNAGRPEHSAEGAVLCLLPATTLTI